MMDAIMAYGREKKCSDIHMTQGAPLVLRIHGQLVKDDTFAEKEEQFGEIILSMLDETQKNRLKNCEDLDFCYTLPGGLRQRVNVYSHQGKVCAAIRLLNDQIPTLEQLHLPKAIQALAGKPHGLVLVTGPTGSGKSTTLAAMIDHINRTRRCHILTIEDPVEYLHQDKNALIHQREVGADTTGFGDALRSALREDPDVILVGEMRDLETISAAITAAETGHLVLSTLHTTGAANTIDRVIDVFPEGDKPQIRTQLSTVLRGVVTQKLMALEDGTGRTAAFEILVANDAVCNLIRENKCYQIGSVLQTGLKDGMCSMDYSLGELVKTGKISMTDAMEQANDKAQLMRYIS